VSRPGGILRVRRGAVLEIQWTDWIFSAHL